MAADLLSLLFVALKWPKRKVQVPEFMQFKDPVLGFDLSIILRQYMTPGFVPLQSGESPRACARSGQSGDQALSQSDLKSRATFLLGPRYRC